MLKYVRLAAFAAATATVFVAPAGASAACWAMGPPQRLVNVPSPWGPAYVDLPVWIDTNPAHCISSARELIEERYVELPPIR